MISQREEERAVLIGILNSLLDQVTKEKKKEGKEEKEEKNFLVK